MASGQAKRVRKNYFFGGLVTLARFFTARETSGFMRTMRERAAGESGARLLNGAGLGYGKSQTIPVHRIENVNRLGRFFARGHFNERVTVRARRFLIGRDRHRGDGTRATE